MTVPPELRALASRALGAADMSSWTCLKILDDGPAVWLATAPDASVVIKQHRHGRAFAQELRAYREWLPRLPLVDDCPRAPTLLAFDARARALALTRVPGERMSLGTSSAPAPDVHAAAGRFARALHGLALADDDPVPLVEAVAARLASWDERARGLLTPAERDGLARLARRSDAFAGVARVPCHRDYTPDNWMVDGTCLHVLDFEHARLDAPESDLVKLRAEVWAAAPDLQAAFLTGYGPLTADALARLDVLLALHAVATLAWARRHVDAAFAARGRQALDAALASL